jgi:hypothetical protein
MIQSTGKREPQHPLAVGASSPIPGSHKQESCSNIHFRVHKWYLLAKEAAWQEEQDLPEYAFIVAGNEFL